jgi:hypothetical protein
MKLVRLLLLAVSQRNGTHKKLLKPKHNNELPLISFPYQLFTNVEYLQLYLFQMRHTQFNSTFNRE